LRQIQLQLHIVAQLSTDHFSALRFCWNNADTAIFNPDQLFEARKKKSKSALSNVSLVLDE